MRIVRGEKTFIDEEKLRQMGKILDLRSNNRKPNYRFSTLAIEQVARKRGMAPPARWRKKEHGESSRDH